MTSFGATQIGEQAGASASPPTAQPVAIAANPTIQVPADATTASRDAAREAALAALSAARSAGHQPGSPGTLPGTVGPAGKPQRLDPLVPRPEPGSPRPGSTSRRARGPLGGVGVLQLMCWQLVLIAVVLALAGQWPRIVVTILVALVVMALSAVRIRGRWLYEWLVLSSRYLLRDRAGDLPDASRSGDPDVGKTGEALLRRISPEAAGITGIVDDGRDSTAFMISRAEGITAVLQPVSAVRDLVRAMPAAQVLLPASDEPALAGAVQVVHHVGVDRARPPRTWVALQALRTVELYRDTDLQQALGNTVRRVQRRLRRDGLPTRTLAEHETLATFAALAHVNAGRGKVREQWRLWQSGPISQAVFRLNGWAELSPATGPQLLRWLLSAAPQTAVTVAVTARRTSAEAEPMVSAALRIAAMSPAAVESAANELAQLARERNVDLARLDGEHAWGLAVTLPLGVVDNA
ncbi:type VII secretion protein EccE [Micromonospora sp. NPDC003197]